MDRKFYAYEDFEPGMSIDLGTRAVTREEVLDYASQFDPQPMHLDDEAASRTVLGKLSASGWHTAAMVMRMMCDAFILNSTSQGSPGLDYMNWKRPVFPGDILSGTSTVLSMRKSKSMPGIGFIQVKTEVRNQHGELVCDMENAGIMGLREAGEAQ